MPFYTTDFLDQDFNVHFADQGTGLNFGTFDYVKYAGPSERFVDAWYLQPFKALVQTVTVPSYCGDGSGGFDCYETATASGSGTATGIACGTCCDCDHAITYTGSGVLTYEDCTSWEFDGNTRLDVVATCTNPDIGDPMHICFGVSCTACETDNTTSTPITPASFYRTDTSYSLGTYLGVEGTMTYSGAGPTSSALASLADDCAAELVDYDPDVAFAIIDDGFTPEFFDTEYVVAETMKAPEAAPYATASLVQFAAVIDNIDELVNTTWNLSYDTFGVALPFNIATDTSTSQSTSTGTMTAQSTSTPGEDLLLSTGILISASTSNNTGKYISPRWCTPDTLPTYAGHTPVYA